MNKRLRVKKVLSLAAVLLLTLWLSGCDWPWEDDDDDIEVSSGSGTVEVDTTSSEDTTTASLTVTSEQEDDDDTETTYSGITEYGNYVGRTNGDRPTWYFSKTMSRYPTTFELNIPGCATGVTVTNNGTRWESGSYLAKQSDVTGRGLAVLAPSSCSSSTAYIVY